MREIKLEEQGIEYREEAEVYIVFCWRILDLEMSSTEEGGLDIDPVIDAGWTICYTKEDTPEAAQAFVKEMMENHTGERYMTLAASVYRGLEVLKAQQNVDQSVDQLVDNLFNPK